jgi:hypothetical protein
MNQMIHDPEMHISYDELLYQHNKTLEELETMPVWADEYQFDDDESSSSLLPTVLWDIRLRQYLLVLHLPFAQRVDTNPRYCYSRVVCLSTANTILDRHSKPSLSGNYSLNLLREDVFQSTLAMCRSIISWSVLQGIDLSLFHYVRQV